METVLLIIGLVLLIVAGYRLMYVAAFKAMSAWQQEQTVKNEDIKKYQH